MKLTARQVAQTGATRIRLLVPWRSVAPAGAEAPASFDATNPADPAYRWASVDDQVRHAVAAGVDPILSIASAPQWARATGWRRLRRPWKRQTRRGRLRPLCTRGSAPLQRHVRGPAARPLLAGLERAEPQALACRPAARRRHAVRPDWYRGMVNAFARAVHSVHARQRRRRRRPRAVLRRRRSRSRTTTGDRSRSCARCSASSKDLQADVQQPRRASTSGRRTRTRPAARRTTRSSRTTSRSATCPRCRPCSTRRSRARPHRVRADAAVLGDRVQLGLEAAGPAAASPTALLKRWVPQALYDDVASRCQPRDLVLAARRLADGQPLPVRALLRERPPEAVSARLPLSARRVPAQSAASTSGDERRRAAWPRDRRAAGARGASGAGSAPLTHEPLRRLRAHVPRAEDRLGPRPPRSAEPTRRCRSRSRPCPTSSSIRSARRSRTLNEDGAAPFVLLVSDAAGRPVEDELGAGAAAASSRERNSIPDRPPACSSRSFGCCATLRQTSSSRGGAPRSTQAGTARCGRAPTRTR